MNKIKLTEAIIRWCERLGAQPGHLEERYWTVHEWTEKFTVRMSDGRWFVTGFVNYYYNRGSFTLYEMEGKEAHDLQYVDFKIADFCIKFSDPESAKIIFKMSLV